MLHPPERRKKSNELLWDSDRPIANAFLRKLDPQAGNEAEPFTESEAD